MPLYRLTEAAKSDLDDVWGYIAEDSQRNANRFLDRLFRQFQLLAQSPNLGVPRPTYGPNVRMFVVRRYLIFYRSAAPAGIDIIRVLHGARDIQALFEN